MHIYTAIRKYIEVLLSGTATAGTNIYVWPNTPVDPAHTPAIIISTGDAVAHEEQTIGISGKQTRLLANTTQIVAACVNEEVPTTECDVQDILDQVELEVERAFHIDQTFGGLVEAIQFVERETEMEITSEAKTGRTLLVHQITVTVDRTNPEV